MKRVFSVLVLFMLCTSAMAMATPTQNAEKAISEFTYYKIGVIWNFDGLDYNPSNKNIKNLHIDGKIANISTYIGSEGINYIRKLDFTFLKLSMMVLLSQEPLPE